MQIRDRIALGVFAGAAATVPQILLNALLVWAGLCKYYDYQVSASVYILRHLTHTASGLAFGAVTWTSIACALGVAIVYLLTWTGSAYWWLKGVAVSYGIMFSLIYGFFYAMEAPKITPWDLGTNWSILADNLLFGLVCSLLVVRWGRGMFEAEHD